MDENTTTSEAPTEAPVEGPVTEETPVAQTPEAPASEVVSE